MIAVVSDLVAQILIEGRYEDLYSEKLALDHFPPELGDVIDLGCGYLTYRHGGWYISGAHPDNIQKARHVLETV